MSIAHAHTPAPESDELDFAYAHSEAGIQRAEDLARSAFEHLLVTLDVARLDCVIGATCLVADLLAMIEYHTGTTPPELVEQFEGAISRRLTAYEAREDTASPPGMVFTDAAIH